MGETGGRKDRSTGKTTNQHPSEPYRPDQGLLKADPEGNSCGGGAIQGYNSYPRRYGCMRVCASMAMLTHNQIWTAIDRLAAPAKLTPSGLARKAGLDPTTFNKS